MRKRTFNISHIVLDNLRQISEDLNINIATLARFAILHGIERIQNGYRPTRDHHPKIKRKFEILLPEETWIKFEKLMQDVAYQIEEHIPDGEMIELFIKIELQKFMYIYEEQDKLSNNGIIYKFSNTDTISVDCQIPTLLYDKLIDKKEKIGIKETQLAKYVTLCGTMQEYGLQHFDTLDTDADLLKEIEKLSLDRVKTLTLIRYLIANNRIIWRSINKNGN